MVGSREKGRGERWEEEGRIRTTMNKGNDDDEERDGGFGDGEETCRARRILS